MDNNKNAAPRRCISPLRAAAVIALLVLLPASCAREEASDESRDLEQRLERLKSVPYTDVSSTEASGDTSGVTLYDPGRAWPGYNLYCMRGDPEAVLLDMDGNVVHRWSYRQDRFNKWTHATMLENGDIIVINRYLYVLCLDWNSNLKWESRSVVHHDVALVDDGSRFVLERVTKRHRGLAVHFDEIARVGPHGEELGAWSTYDNLQDLKSALQAGSFLDDVLDTLIAGGLEPDTLREVPGRLEVDRFGKPASGEISVAYDYFHTNTITVLPDTPLGRSDSRFAAGHLLICLRNVNQIAVLDWDSKKILWSWGEGVLEWPHHPTMLENGNILIFDNGIVRRHSKVIELDPLAETVVWEYVADPPERFYTPEKGSAQRLPNGNTLICEGDMGRVFEVTLEGETVWEWYNPVINDNRRVVLYRMIRYPREMVEPLLEGSSD